MYPRFSLIVEPQNHLHESLLLHASLSLWLLSVSCVNTYIIPIMIILQRVSSISLVVHALHMLDCMTLRVHYTVAFMSTLLLVIHSPFLTPTLLLPIPCNGTMSSTRHQQSSSLWVLVLCHYALHSSCDITWSHVSWEISHCRDHPHCLHASHKVPWSNGWSNAWLSIHFSSLWKTLSSLTQVSFVDIVANFCLFVMHSFFISQNSLADWHFNSF